MYFVGSYALKLDDKGRITLPARYREVLAAGVMVTKGQGRSLAVYLREDFEELAARVVEAAKRNPQAQIYQRNLSASTDEQRPDSQGRIGINGDLRGYAGLAKDCIVNGNMNRLEIWDAEAWQAYQNENEETYALQGVEAFYLET